MPGSRSEHPDRTSTPSEPLHGGSSPTFIERPVLTCQAIDEVAGCEVFLKCENLQKVGAFKARGGE